MARLPMPDSRMEYPDVSCRLGRRQPLGQEQDDPYTLDVLQEMVPVRGNRGQRPADTIIVDGKANVLSYPPNLPCLPKQVTYSCKIIH